MSAVAETADHFRSFRARLHPSQGIENLPTGLLPMSNPAFGKVAQLPFGEPAASYGRSAR
jgi:hypothetical protein